MDHGEATGEKVPAAEAAATPNAAEEALSFEEALGRLELLVRKMEEGKLSLEELTASFEEGRRLARVCRARIGRLERKIEILLKDDGENGSWREFDPGDSAPPAGSRRNTAEELL